MKEKLLLKLHDYSTKINEDNFLSLLERQPSAVMIDLGCGDGNFAIKCAKKVGTNKLWGVEIVEEYARKAREKGVRVIKANLNLKLPVESNFFDVVIANQVMEHLIDADVFVEEIYRILKYKGYAVISTENLSSWHNIYALLLGYRPFSLDYSFRMKIGNPLSLHNMEIIKQKSLTHVKVFTYFAFKEIFQIYGFKVENLVGGGYYPFPVKFLSKIIGKIDPKHAHFMTIKVRKDE